MLLAASTFVSVVEITGASDLAADFTSLPYGETPVAYGVFHDFRLPVLGVKRARYGSSAFMIVFPRTVEG